MKAVVRQGVLAATVGAALYQSAQAGDGESAARHSQARARQPAPADARRANNAADGRRPPPDDTCASKHGRGGSRQSSWKRVRSDMLEQGAQPSDLQVLQLLFSNLQRSTLASSRDMLDVSSAMAWMQKNEGMSEIHDVENRRIWRNAILGGEPHAVMAESIHRWDGVWAECKAGGSVASEQGFKAIAAALNDDPWAEQTVRQNRAGLRDEIIEQILAHRRRAKSGAGSKMPRAVEALPWVKQLKWEVLAERDEIDVEVDFMLDKKKPFWWFRKLVRKFAVIEVDSSDDALSDLQATFELVQDNDIPETHSHTAPAGEARRRVAAFLCDALVRSPQLLDILEHESWAMSIFDERLQIFDERLQDLSQRSPWAQFAVENTLHVRMHVLNRQLGLVRVEELNRGERPAARRAPEEVKIPALWFEVWPHAGFLPGGAMAAAVIYAMVCFAVKRRARGARAAPEDLEDCLCCPISLMRMVHPVTDTDGYTWERSCIEAHLATDATSPITRNPINAHQLVPNRVLADIIRLQGP